MVRYKSRGLLFTLVNDAELDLQRLFRCLAPLEFGRPCESGFARASNHIGIRDRNPLNPRNPRLTH
jgi:hypothetical protein